MSNTGNRVDFCYFCNNWQVEYPTRTPLAVVNQVLSDHVDECVFGTELIHYAGEVFREADALLRGNGQGT